MGRHHSSRSSSSTVSSLSSSSTTLSSLCSRLNSALKTPRWTSTSTSSVRTSKITLRSSHHGRMRRQQRALSKYELRKAMKHGKRKNLACGRRLEYRHNGLVVIVDRITKTEITSYKAVDDIPYQQVSPAQRLEHDTARQANQEQVRSSVICFSFLFFLLLQDRTDNPDIILDDSFLFFNYSLTNARVIPSCWSIPADPCEHRTFRAAVPVLPLSFWPWRKTLFALASKPLDGVSKMPCL